MRHYLLAALLLAAPLAAQNRKSSPMLGALKAELTRSMEQLKKQPTPPYFLSYEVVEMETANVNGSFGTLLNSNPHSRARTLSIDLRVGDFKLDNTHPIRGAGMIFGDNFNTYPLPIDDNPEAIRALVWYYTDQKYKRAVEQYISVKTNVKVKADETDKSGDFSPARPET